MRRFTSAVVLAGGLALSSASLVAAAPQQRNESSQDRAYPVDNRQVETLLKRIGQKAGKFDKSLERAFDGDRDDDRRGQGDARESVRDLQRTADRLRDRFRDRQLNTRDVESVLQLGSRIDRFMQRRGLRPQTEREWVALRGDLDALARASNVAWTWADSEYRTAGPSLGRSLLTGTYELQREGSDDPRRAAEQAVRDLPSDRRQRASERLLNRLEAPARLAIERWGNSVTMASTQGRPVTVEADGRSQQERWPGERTMTTRAAFEGEQLVVTTSGNRGSDFTVTFDPLDGGRTMRMTRTLDDDDLRRPVTVRSLYRRVSEEARWDTGTDGRRSRTGAGSSARDGGVPYGTRLVAQLDDALSTKNARTGDRYTMTVRSPSAYEGAVIEGFVASAVDADDNGRGPARMTLALRSIRLRNGRSYAFDGEIGEIRTPDGDAVRLDREGTAASDESRGRDAVQRGAVGAALGAIIGAVTGGGQGAAIGAAIGAGGGAATVLLNGRDDLDLKAGTEVTLIAGDSR